MIIQTVRIILHLMQPRPKIIRKIIVGTFLIVQILTMNKCCINLSHYLPSDYIMNGRRRGLSGWVSDAKEKW